MIFLLTNGLGSDKIEGNGNTFLDDVTLVGWTSSVFCSNFKGKARKLVNWRFKG